jgi:hypothetical protein
MLAGRRLGSTGRGQCGWRLRAIAITLASVVVLPIELHYPAVDFKLHNHHLR